MRFHNASATSSFSLSDCSSGVGACRKLLVKKFPGRSRCAPGTVVGVLLTLFNARVRALIFFLPTCLTVSRPGVYTQPARRRTLYSKYLTLHSGTRSSSSSFANFMSGFGDDLDSGRHCNAQGASLWVFFGAQFSTRLCGTFMQDPWRVVSSPSIEARLEASPG